MPDIFEPNRISFYHWRAMLRMHRFGLAVILLLLVSVTMASDQYIVTAPPAWVTDTQYEKSKDSSRDSVDGQYDHLYDLQIDFRNKLRGPQAFVQFATELLNTTGVAHRSTINISFDPTYQSVHLHNIEVIRGEQVIDKLDSATIQLLQRELDADSLIYDGRRTLNIILKDIRVGDLLEYSYSKLGVNPVYDDLTEVTTATNWQTPLGKLAMRLLVPVNEPLTINKNNTDMEVSVTEHEGYREYSLQESQVESIFYDDDTPQWIDPQGYITLTETPNWSDVVDWAAPLFNNAIHNDSRIESIAQSIAKEHNEIPDQIGAALHWVQDEIRYLGIEFGTNSHRPSSPGEVLDRRFGDCKDKSVLLVSLLRALGIESDVALTNTRRTYGMPDHSARLDAFNHSLVHLNYNGESHWLEPTYTYQRGSLGDFYEPDYGYALLLNNSSTDLVQMAKQTSVTGKVINKTFNVYSSEEQPTTLTVHTIANGLQAEIIRENINRDEESSIIRNYEKYYARYYKKTMMQGGIDFTDHPNNSIESKESYHLTNFWLKDDDSINYTWLYADEIYEYLNLPNAMTHRTNPYKIAHPRTIQENLSISTPFKLDNDSDYFREDNKHFTFTREMSTDTKTNQIILKYSYATKADHVMVDDLQEYSADVESVKDYLSFFVEGNKRESTAALAQMEREDNQLYIYIGLFAAFALPFIYAVIEWLTERSRHKNIPTGIFYPVSIRKYIVMCVLTFSVYPLYWFYKNFHYMRNTLKQKILPAMRALFSVIFLYSLVKAINLETQRTTRKRYFNVWWSILIPIAYFFVSIFGNIGWLASGLTALLLLLSLLLLIPLVSSIKRLNQNDQAALAFNSRFRYRHLAMFSCVLLGAALFAATESALIPSDEVKVGEDLWDFQKEHLVVNNLIPEDENVQMFFSDALLDMRNDGTGFTKKRLFSYWLDELGNLQWRNIPFEDIVSISMDEQVQDDTIQLTVNLQDDSTWKLWAPGRSLGGAKFTFRLQALIAGWHS